MTTFETLVLKEIEVNGYLMKVYESDPYYHVEVSKKGKHVDDHLLMNDDSELETLKRKYKRMK